MDKENKTRRLLFRIGTVLILVGICVWMIIVGRGHTVYFDNKKLEYEGETYEPPYKITVFVKGEQVAKLNKKDRGMATTIGQNFGFTLQIMKEKKGEEPLDENGEPISVDTRKGYFSDDIAHTFGVPMEQHLAETEVSEMDGFVNIALLTGPRKAVKPGEGQGAENQATENQEAPDNQEAQTEPAQEPTEDDVGATYDRQDE